MIGKALDKYPYRVYNINIPTMKRKEYDSAMSCCHKTKKRSDEEKRRLVNRLSRIEGQIRGIRGMVEDDVYCIDILTQAAAASSALDAFSRELLDTHIRTCVIDDIRSGNDQTVDELTDILKRLLK